MTDEGPAVLVEDAIKLVISEVGYDERDLKDRGAGIFYENGRRNAAKNIVGKFKYLEERILRRH